MAKTQNSLVQEQILQGVMEKRICDFGHDSPPPCQLYAATLHLINTTARASCMCWCKEAGVYQG